MKKYEARFVGASNAGVRRAIREVASRHDDSTPEEIERAILNVAKRVALTVQGQATLELVAEDYRAAQAREKGDE